MAVNDAARANDQVQPTTVTWVATANGDTFGIMSGGGGNQSAPVWVISLSGQFLLTHTTSITPGPLHCSQITDVISQQTGAAAGDYSCGISVPNLSSVGTPETDSLLGLSPTLGWARMPKLLGLTSARAETAFAQIEHRMLVHVTVENLPASQATRLPTSRCGTVVAQLPAVGAQVTPWTAIVLLVDDSAGQASVPR
jgi:hypothetical protein